MEHETYSIAPAETTLAQLHLRGIMLVMNSSKTAAEIAAIQKRLTMSGPFVCENGAALCMPNQNGIQQQDFGRRREEWLPQVHALRIQHKLQFEGFADWSVQQVAEMTGLTPAAAELAKTREFSEPILWRSSSNELQLFRERLAELQLRLLEGGRFLSIQGQHDKSLAMRWLVRQQADRKVVTVALGDSPNDAAMLEAANIAVVIKSAKSDCLQLQLPDRVIHTRLPGPSGWQEAMQQILSWLDQGELSTIGR